MKIKKAVGSIHLVLGLVSGLIVFIVALTGCLYAFQEEIQNLSQPYRFVEVQDKPYKLPSELKTVAEQKMDSLKVKRIIYGGVDKSATVDMAGPKGAFYKLSINPYTAEVLHIKNYRQDFFTIVLYLHMYLLLPPKIGEPIVASATLIFLVMLITGLILWWPKNKSAARQRFSIKWNAQWRRVNYDLHNILGFYALLVAFVIAFTGLVWGFEWFAQSVYWLSSTGKPMVKYKAPLSDTTQVTLKYTVENADKAWQKVYAETPGLTAISVSFPADNKAPIAVSANPDRGLYYRVDFHYFDQYTLKELPVKHYRGLYKNASFADVVTRLNYDVHVGAIGGLAGKTLAFLTSLVVASLPLSGFIIWRGRKKKKIKKAAKMNVASAKPISGDLGVRFEAQKA